MRIVEVKIESSDTKIRVGWLTSKVSLVREFVSFGAVLEISLKMSYIFTRVPRVNSCTVKYSMTKSCLLLTYCTVKAKVESGKGSCSWEGMI